MAVGAYGARGGHAHRRHVSSRKCARRGPSAKASRPSGRRGRGGLHAERWTRDASQPGGRPTGWVSGDGYPIWHVASPSRPPQIVSYRSTACSKFPHTNIYKVRSAARENTCINNGNFESLTPRSLIESPHRHVDPSGYSSAQCGPRASDTHTTKVPGRPPLALGSRRVLPHGHTSRTYAYSTCTPCRVSTYTGSPASSHMRAELHFPSVPFLH